MLSFYFRVKKVSDTISLLIPCSSEGAHSTEFDGSRSGAGLSRNEPVHERSLHEIFPVFFPDTGNCSQRRVGYRLAPPPYILSNFRLFSWNCG